MWGDAAAQQGRGTGCCFLVKTMLSAPNLPEIPAFLNTCKIRGLAVLTIFRQCIVIRRAQSLIIQEVYFFFPVADLERCVPVPRDPLGFKSNSCFTDWIKYGVLLGGAGL